MYGFVRAVCASPNVSLADCKKNAQEIILLLERAQKKEAAIVVFPELCISGSTCADLFYQNTLLEAAQNELINIAAAAKKSIVVVGLPFAYNNNIYNITAFCANGKVCALVPKNPKKNGVFSAPFNTLKTVHLYDQEKNPYLVPFGQHIMLYDSQNENITIAAYDEYNQTDALIVTHSDAQKTFSGTAERQTLLARAESMQKNCAYLLANAGKGESSTDNVFGAQNLIAENGTLLKKSVSFAADSFLCADIDCELLLSERRKNDFYSQNNKDGFLKIPMQITQLKISAKTELERIIPANPFLAQEISEEKICNNIMQIQVAGLIQRLQFTGVKKAIIGISGGLDSTLALLVAFEAFNQLQFETKNIIAVTMPCFGTTKRTKKNAAALAKILNVSFLEIPIKDAVLQHFADIGHNPQTHNAAYENAQARERTQVLLDLANDNNALVIGTGDLSELALGWATYNGDHMSNYGVNASVPKTLVRRIVDFYAQKSEIEQKTANTKLSETLKDILNTPVSPELLPPQNDTNDTIEQQTENIIGSYDLHDFFLYYAVKYGFSPQKIEFLAKKAFQTGTKNELFSAQEIKKCLTVFFSRFFSQQFKRSCSPDGVQATEISLSPRGGFNMPSDAQALLWLNQL